MRAPRFSAAAALVAVIALLSAPVTAATATEQPDARASARPVAPVGDEPARMIEVDPADFVDAGAELPVELQQALARDVGLTGAQWLAQSEAANAAADVVADLHEVIEVVDARLEGYDLVVTVESTTDARIAESVGARVEFGSAAEVRESDYLEGVEPAADLRGGLPYTFGNFRCSIGFVGKNVATNQLQMMSAGHCQDTAGSMRTYREPTAPTIAGGTFGASIDIGNAGPHYIDLRPNPGWSDPTYYDLGMTPVTTAGWVGKPEVATWGFSTTGAPMQTDALVIRDAGPTVVGATICKSGSTTGWTCGQVTVVDAVVKVGGVPGNNNCADSTRDYCVGSIVSDICVRQGDSGGAGVVGSRAVGITSAASNSSPANPCSTEGNLGVFATLYSVNPAWEQVSKVFSTWEPLVAVAAPTVSINGKVLSGTVPFSGVRHTVSVTFSTGETLTAQVQADETWSLDASGTNPITKTFVATARWGQGSVSTPVSGTLPGASTQRLSGDDRYQTAIKISESAFPCGSPNPSMCSPGQVPVVYIANGLNFPDALSAGPAATLEGGPLLLTNGSSISNAVANELNRLKPTTIVIVGGTGVVSPSAEAALAPFASAPNPADKVVRLGGSTRYETSRLIAQRLLTKGLISAGTELWVATGTDYPDALSAGAAAAGAGVPILLVFGPAASLDTPTRNFIQDTLAASKVYIAGGTGVVSVGIQNQLGTLVGGSANVQRAGGDNRFATSLQINQLAFPAAAPHAPAVYLTFGFNFPDALAGGVLAGTVGGPLYITQTPCVTSGIVDHIIAVDPNRVVVFGGTAIVSNNARDLRRC